MSFFKIFIIVASFFSLLTLATPALAQTPGPDLGLRFGAETGLTPTDPRRVVAQIIFVALGLLGTIAVVIFLYAGFKWMTSGGNEDAIGEARKMMLAAVIGLAIILSAYAITKFVVTQLFKATTGQEYRGE